MHTSDTPQTHGHCANILLPVNPPEQPAPQPPNEHELALERQRVDDHGARRVLVNFGRIRTFSRLDVEHRKDRDYRHSDSFRSDMQTRTYPPTESEGFVAHRHVRIYRGLELVEEAGWVEFEWVPSLVFWIVCGEYPGRRHVKNHVSRYGKERHGGCPRR
ncbi:hypothetical protein CC1G_10324 [Coprinopsis cinerea okayama7|uniref:Uncharacterized protein n=1 Tax=Coprinopsis cinerea (strain Okayama-7 / 130 / ATCC MYA-4618 / FGSC 9003) TaxID=240176 RepID=A8P0J2_COPC7|nr:hypothetical protein CC1G_10324 [Coprinopsis cinerea okayama7\|eukprot:XP_001837903.2 hypothetical protein CC1G_10324 [Coprinopsis cinerea okayama7\